MPLYVFGCSQGHRTERLVPVGTEEAVCLACGETCGRVYGYSVAITQPEVDTRGMFRRFTEASAEMEHKGQVGPAPYPVLKRRAEAISRAGENPWQRS